ncbi:MAG: protein-L-isoaspartate O-methyltransferase [Nanoarchaeota archaeon]|nr:protein-L-isoaspartate O-methyltransferase [Nanoarchaeota archaeon]
MHPKTTLLNFWKENFNFKISELDAFKEIERENFIPEEIQHLAYEDTPLPILRGKTISQPTTVMIMTSALELKKGEKVFEIGTGSGYQTALIGKIIGEKGRVITTEVIPELIDYAEKNLKISKLNNIELHEIDGSRGLQKEAPFDKIILTAACKDFPQELIEELKPNGIIIGPIGNKNEQMMVKAIKQKNNDLEYEFLGPFLFSPLYGDYGFEV